MRFCVSSSLFPKRAISVFFSKLKLVFAKIPGGGALSYKRLMGMCRWMGSHFHEKHKKSSCVASPLILLSQSYQRTMDFFVVSLR